MATQDLHIVIGAKRQDAASDHPVGYVVLSAPLTWDKAQELWDRFDRDRRDGMRSARGFDYYMVRDISDPCWAGLVSRGYANGVSRTTGRHNGVTGASKAARAWAKDHGYKGAGGGWVYDPNGKPYVQGWDSLANILRRRGKIAQGSDGKWYVLDQEVVK